MPKLIRPAVDRFATKIALSDTGCIVWIGGTNNVGYGTFSVGDRNSTTAHRWSYEYHKGQIPHGLVIDHLCRNKLCVNPAHLEAVTQHTNLLRAVGIGKHNTTKTHCPAGHPYSADNLYVAPLRSNRQCRTCRRNSKLKSKENAA